MIFLLYSTSFSVSFTIYIGLFLTSKYVLDKYIPITPKKNNCTPDTKITIHASEGHPDTGSPNASVLIIITSIAINAIKQNRSEEHTSELQSRFDLVCRLLLEKKKKQIKEE